MRKIFRQCDLFGLLAFHCRDSRRSPGKGFPDLVITGPKGTLIRELKDQNGSLDPNQRRWATWMIAGSENWDLWKPSHLANGIIVSQLAVIAGHAAPGPGVFLNLPQEVHSVYENDKAMANYLRANAGREISSGELARALNLSTYDIAPVLYRISTKDRRIVHVRRGWWLYKGQPPAALVPPAPPAPPAPLPGVDPKIFEVDGVIEAIDRLTAAIKDQTDKFTNEGIVMH